MYLRKSYLPGFLLYILVVFFIIFDFQDYLGREPQSVHHWRQSDGASIALNYYQHGMNFFQPEIHFQNADHNTSGYGAGEFPILYYATACLYQLFGPHSPFLRIINTLIFFIGLFYLYKGIRERFKDKFWAFFIPTMLAVSPVILFYSNNYLPDTPALGLVLIAWYHIGRYDQLKQSKSIWYLAFFFCFAGLLKISALLSFIPILGLALLSFLPFKKWHFFHHPIQAILALLSVLGINIIWYKWAINYNTLHGTSYFSTHTWPYNSLDDETIANVWNNIIYLWGDDYSYPATYVFLLLILVVLLKNLKKLSSFWIYILGSLSVGLFIFGYLFFLNLMNHDYYTINLYIIPVLLMIAVLDLYQRKHSQLIHSWLWKFVLTIFIIFNIQYGNKQLKGRYTGWQNDMSLYTPLDGIPNFLREQGIQQEDRFLVVGDPTPNTALYRMNQKGWSDLYGNGDSVEKIQKLLDEKGLSYMVILNNKFLEERPFLKQFCTTVKAEYKGLKIYDLR